MPGRRLKCSYRERGRRCPRDGTGNPPLCAAHRIAFQEAARPRRPTEVIAEAVVAFIQGGEVDAAQTVRVFDALFGAGFGGAGGAGAGYTGGGGGGGAGWTWVGVDRGAPRQDAPRAPPYDPRQRSLEIEARQVLGFSPSEPLTQELIKSRRRRMATRYHSDRTGGSDAKMRTINAATDVLLAGL